MAVNFVLRFEEKDQSFKARFEESKHGFNTNFGKVTVITKVLGGGIYEGSYDVTPTVESQTMETKDKYMKDDVRIKAIPIYNASNLAGGTTFYIATMDENPQGGIAMLGMAKLGSMIL